MVKKIAFFMSVVLLSACGAVKTMIVDFDDPKIVAESVSVNKDKFKKMVMYEAPFLPSEAGDKVKMRAWKWVERDKWVYQVYAFDTYKSQTFRNYDRAYDDQGNRLDTTLVDKDVQSCKADEGCHYAEHITINLPRDYLEKKIEGGFSFKISGSGEEQVFVVPGSYIDGFLSVAK